MKLFASGFVLLILSSCHYGQGPPQSTCKIQELAIDAALGDAQAQHYLGVEFHRGVDIPQDFGKAAAMWRRASEGGIVASFNNLGHLTYYGKGIQQDYSLADAYSDGSFLKRDYPEAYAWAKTGKHYASQMEDTELGKSIQEMADNVLAEVRKQLSKPQITEAEKKTADYIAKFGPK